MIIERIKQESGIDVLLKSRRREQVEMKALASYLLREEGLSLCQIARELNLDHSTIIHHLKIYPSLKQYNKRIQQIEDKIKGKKPDVVVESLQTKLEAKDLEIKELKARIEQLQPNEQINRLITLLDNEDIKDKFEAFLTINEKARYYKKYD